MDEKIAVLQAENQFFAALNEIFVGNLAPMTALWSHADDVIYMGPDGLLRVGWAAVRADWEKQAAMKLGGEVHPLELHMTVGRDIAVTHRFGEGANLDSAGKPLKVSIRGTNVFRKEDGQWKMIAHHSDPLPYLKE